MKLSTKGRYALVALIDLAKNSAVKPIATTELSQRQDISLAYLEQLFAKMRRFGLVVSVRGPGGGYQLAKPAAQITIEQILSAVDETFNALQTGAGAKGAATGTDEQVLANRLWEGLSAQVYLFLHHTTLADVTGDALSPCPAAPTFLEFEDA
ncbi:MAG: Rrf2 family transcriptional regulator [Pseudomonadota bacterium]